MQGTKQEWLFVRRIVMVHLTAVYSIIVVIRVDLLCWWPCLYSKKLIIFTKKNDIHEVIRCMIKVYIVRREKKRRFIVSLCMTSLLIKFMRVATHTTLYINVNNSVHFDSLAFLFLHIKTNRKGHSC